MKKNVYYANFNVTFGKDNEPMIKHFFDIIFPSFQMDYKSEPKESTSLFFSNTQMLDVNDTFYLVGYFIKNTLLRRETVWNGTLEESPDSIPSAPYSRFYINLKNHRMVLVKNEKNSPTISSLRQHMSSLLRNYIHLTNEKKEKTSQLPSGNVNIIELVMEEEIDKIFDDIEKINNIVFKLFPLNNDIDNSDFLDGIRRTMPEFDSKSTNVQVNTPKDKSKSKEIVREVSLKGTAQVQVNAEHKNGEKIKFSNESYKTTRSIEIKGNLNQNFDAIIIEKANNEQVFSLISDENLEAYNFFLEDLLKYK